MALYNLSEHSKAMETLLNTVIPITNHEGIKFKVVIHYSL